MSCCIFHWLKILSGKTVYIHPLAQSVVPHLLPTPPAGVIPQKLVNLTNVKGLLMNYPTNSQVVNK